MTIKRFLVLAELSDKTLKQVVLDKEQMDMITSVCSQKVPIKIVDDELPLRIDEK